MAAQLFISIEDSSCVVLLWHDIQGVLCSPHYRLSLWLGRCLSVELARIPPHRSSWSLQWGCNNARRTHCLSPQIRFFIRDQSIERLTENEEGSRTTSLMARDGKCVKNILSLYGERIWGEACVTLTCHLDCCFFFLPQTLVIIINPHWMFLTTEDRKEAWHKTSHSLFLFYMWSLQSAWGCSLINRHTAKGLVRRWGNGLPVKNQKKNQISYSYIAFSRLESNEHCQK